MGERASLYVRLSKAPAERNLSRQGMIEDLRRLCAERGFVEVALHVDDGRSGESRNRAGFNAWLADATEGRADVLVAWHVDRLTREGLSVAAKILDVIEGKDDTGRVVRPPVRLIGYDDRLDSADGDAFRLTFVIKAEIARAELARMKSRSQARVRRLRAERRATGGLIPYGYQKSRGPYELEHDPVSAPILREIVAKVIDGASIASVARELNAKGIPTPRDHAAMRGTGKPRVDRATGEPLPPQRWTDTTIRRMLTNPVLLGRLTDRGRIVRDATGAPVLRGEPLISEPDWNALQTAIEQGCKPKTRRAEGSLLSGLAFCSQCGEVLYFHWAVKPWQEYRYYRCSGRTRHGNGCDAGAPRADALERLAVELLLDAIGDLDVTRRVFVPGDDAATELADVEDRMAALRDDRAAGLYRGEKGTAEFREMYSALERRRAELAGRQARPDGWEYVPTGQTYRQKWEGTDGLEARHRLLASTGVRVEAVRVPGDVTSPPVMLPGDDEYPVVVTAARDGVQAAVRLPSGLAERVTGQPGARVVFGQPALLAGVEDRNVTI